MSPVKYIFVHANLDFVLFVFFVGEYKFQKGKNSVESQCDKSP